MRWYTDQNNLLCVGLTQSSGEQSFRIETPLYSKTSINKSMTEEDIKLIGSFPEDWPHDKAISEKVTSAAQKLFKEKLINW